MNRGIYATATGMATSQQWMDVIANNLANVNTNGFKQDGLVFNEAFRREMLSNGQDIGSLGSGPTPGAMTTDFSQGPLVHTANPLDVAILTDAGMFKVQTPAGTRYTRDGSFALRQSGQGFDLVTQHGNQVLDDQGNPIQIPPGDIMIANDGQVSVAGKKIAQLGIYDGTFIKEGNNLLNSTDATPMKAISVREATLETSNVNAVATMVEMIKLNRGFDLAQKSVQTQDDMNSKLMQTLQ